MRETLQRSKNGQPVYEIATYDALTPDEKQMLIVANGTTINDWQNFQVYHNKKGVLLRVTTYQLKAAKIKARKPDILTILTAFSPQAAPHERHLARKWLTTTGLYSTGKTVYRLISHE